MMGWITGAGCGCRSRLLLWLFPVSVMTRHFPLVATVLSTVILSAASPMPLLGGLKPFEAKIMRESGSIDPVTIWAKDYIDAKRQLDRQCQKPCRIIEDVR